MLFFRQLFLILCFSSSLYAQQHSMSVDIETFNHLKRNEDVGRITSYEKAQKAYLDIKGKPLLFKQPKKCTLTDINGQIIERVLINYDLYYDEFFSLQDLKIFLLNNKFYSGFEYQDKNGISKVYKHFPQFEGNYYVEVLFESDVITFVKDITIDLRHNYKHVAGVDFNESRFIRKNKYYIFDGEGGIHQVKLKNKSIRNNLPKKYQVLWKHMVKKNRLRIRKEKHVVDVLTKIVL